MGTQIPNYRLNTKTAMPYESNYLDYGGTPVNPAPQASSGGGSNWAESGGDALTTAGALSGNPYIAGAGLVLKGAGTIASMYGDSKAHDHQMAMEEEARQELKRQQMIQEEERKKKDQAQYLANLFNYGDYGQKSDANRLNQYQDYFRQVGS